MRRRRGRGTRGSRDVRPVLRRRSPGRRAGVPSAERGGCRERTLHWDEKQGKDSLHGADDASGFRPAERRSRLARPAVDISPSSHTSPCPPRSPPLWTTPRSSTADTKRLKQGCGTDRRSCRHPWARPPKWESELTLNLPLLSCSDATRSATKPWAESSRTRDKEQGRSLPGARGRGL